MSGPRTLVIITALLLGTAIASSCGGAEDGTPGTPTGTPAGQGGGSTTTTGVGGAGGGGGSVPAPTPREPCEQDNCWLNAPRLSGLCGTATIDEDFQTGLYDVVGVGDQIGTNGMTGNALSEHVHFVYLDAPDVTSAGTDEQKSEKVNQYVDSLCR